MPSQNDGAGYTTLTRKVPTYQHHCLSHVLSTHNVGSDYGQTEVWGGPLAGAHRSPLLSVTSVTQHIGQRTDMHMHIYGRMHARRARWSLVHALAGTLYVQAEIM